MFGFSLVNAVGFWTHAQYYTFVPILPQGMRRYGVGEGDLDVLCILYPAFAIVMDT